MTLLYTLQTCYSILSKSSDIDNIKLTTKVPIQIIIRLKYGTLLIFNSGQYRCMGKVSLTNVNHMLNSIQCIISDSIMQPHLVSETVVFNMHSSICPLNLYLLAEKYKNNANVRFECELFPALTLHFWKPLHVNVFSSGKVIVLGFNASSIIYNVDNWINTNATLL